MIFLVLIKGFNKPENRIFCGIAISIGIWGLGGAFFSGVPQDNPNLALFWEQIAYAGTIFVPVFYTHFVIKYLKLNKKLIILFSYILGIFFLILVCFKPNLFFGKLKFMFNKFYYVDWITSRSITYLLFYISLYWLLLSYSFFLLIKKYKHTKGIERDQLKYFILGSITGWIGAHGIYLPKFGLKIYPYSNFLIAIYPIIFVYAILRYRLMDIKVAITRTGIFLAVYTLILGLPFAIGGYFKNWLFQVFGPNWWVLPLGLMAALATTGPFIYIYLQRKAEDQLLKEQKRYQDTLKQAAIGMTRIRNLTRLLSLITHIVTKTVRISFASIYLLNKENDEYVLQVSRDKGKALLSKFSSNQPLITWIISYHQPLIYEEIKRQMQDTNVPLFKALEEDMRMLGAAVVVPSFLDQKLTGFIVLGDKLSGQIYSPDDLNVFQVLASQAALAIENAQFYEEAKEMQAQIAQAEKMATVGTMADGLSHQINNRFYALSLIAGDTIDTIKMTDTSKCSPEVSSMINQIVSALERIQINVMQGGEVVKGILKYTRKGEEGMEPLTLDQIIDGTLEMVQYKVKLPEIDLIRDYSKDIPKIKGNLVQMQEVFFNFIDNAYDAIVERRNTLKEDGYRGKIAISAKPKDNTLEVIVQDNGMGVKNDDIKKIFTPFFTTKVSSRKGTGLGLYVIRNIITETHKGKIIFESEYKIGTRFILELPIAQ